MKSPRSRVLLGTILLLLSCAGQSLRADDLLFGMSTVLSGPASELGLNVKAGVEAAFLEANQAGGVSGHKLKLLALDDGYEPARTAPNMHKLIEEHQVLGIIGNVGTPTAVVAMPIANSSQTLFFGAFTGASLLRKTPPDRYVFNYRASYAQETAAMVDALVDVVGLRPEEIAFFTQRDAYGDSGFVSGVEALKNHGLVSEANIIHGRYERNTDIVENALADMLGAVNPPRAVIMVGAYQPCARFIQLAREYELNAILLNVSFVGAEQLCHAAGPAGEGVIITQVVPSVHSDLSLVRRFHQAWDKLELEHLPTFAGMEGYISGTILVKALREIEGPLTRDSIVGAIESLGRFDIGLGRELRLSPTHHQACDDIWPTRIRNGKVEAMDWHQLGELGSQRK